MKPESLTPAEIGELLNTLEALYRIGESVKAHAVVLAHQGVEIPGWKASLTAARRMWTDEEQAALALRALGLSKQEQYTVTLLSPAQAEKTLKTKKLWPKVPRGNEGREFADPLKPLLSYTDTKQTIVRASVESTEE